MNQLESLKALSVVVADTGDFNQLKEFTPQDATTNPSLILAASALPEYAHLVADALEYGKKQGLTGEQLLEEVCDRMAVNFGKQILEIVPGVVSTEVDANLSFDKEALIAKARKLIEMYDAVGVNKDRILIKMASTWEGCEAARVLEAEGIHCNMTLLFSLCQAVAAAEAKATLISPFVGRILDWHKSKYPTKCYDGDADPGVQSVRQIYCYYKQHSYSTIVMGASFRSSAEVLSLAGCDKLTISPKLLKELASTSGSVVAKLSGEAARQANAVPKIEMTEALFRWMLNEDQMATEKLSDGIRVFHADMVKLKAYISQQL